MTPPVLLCYNLEGDRGAKIRMAAMRHRIRLRAVTADEYGQTLAALCGLEDATDAVPDGSFTDEMLVMANFPNPLANAFLQTLRQSRIAPVRLKAMLTPTNSRWTSLQLHHELSREDEAFRTHKPAVHNEAGGPLS